MVRDSLLAWGVLGCRNKLDGWYKRNLEVGLARWEKTERDREETAWTPGCLRSDRLADGVRDEAEIGEVRRKQSRGGSICL